MTKKIYKDECTILAKKEGAHTGCKVVYDGDGDEVEVFPSNWSDDMIWTVVNYLNKSYERGVRDGRSHLQQEVRNMLGIN